MIDQSFRAAESTVGTDLLVFQRSDDKVVQAVGLTDADGNQCGTPASPLPVTVPDSALNDAFARLRVSEPRMLLDVKRVGSTPDWMASDAVTGTGAAAYQANRSSTYLTVGSAVGTAVRQSKARAVYQPGKSLLMFHTFVLAGAQTNLRQRCGYFDPKNGVFLQLSGSTLSVVRRSYVGGSASDTAVAQAAWNVDPMDGSGPSGITLDLTKAQILFADFEWLGVGRVRVGFVVDGRPVYCHQFLNSNRTLASVYMTNPNLPVRWEIEATGTISGTATLEAICASVSSEGGYEPSGFLGCADSGTTANAIASGASEELLAVRMQAAFTDYATAYPGAMSVINTTSGPFRWQLVLNPTATVAGTWSAVPGSIMERNSTRTVTAGTGTVIATGYVSAQSNQVAFDAHPIWKMGTDLAGVTDVLSLRTHNLSNQSEDYYGSLSWHAMY